MNTATTSGISSAASRAQQDSAAMKCRNCSSVASRLTTVFLGLVSLFAFKDSPKGVPGVQCGAQSGENGCLFVTKHNCRIWYVVDRSTDRITAWRYAGPAEDCWRLSLTG